MPEPGKERSPERGADSARRYGLFGVSAYPRKSGMGKDQRESMARWAGVVVVLLTVAVAVLVVAGSRSGGLTVTFDSRGGSSVESQAVPYGELAADPGEVLRPGYRLMGWSTDPDGQHPWNFQEDTVTETLTLYAVWGSLMVKNEGP